MAMCDFLVISAPRIPFMHIHLSSPALFFFFTRFAFCFLKLTHIHCLLIPGGIVLLKRLRKNVKARVCVSKRRRMDAGNVHNWPWRGFGSWRSSSAARRWPPCSPRPWPSSARWTPCPNSSACGEGWGQRSWPDSGTSSYFPWPVFVERCRKCSFGTCVFTTLDIGNNFSCMNTLMGLF